MKLLCNLGFHRWKPENLESVIDIHGVKHARGSQGVPRYRDCEWCDKRQLFVFGKWQ